VNTPISTRSATIVSQSLPMMRRKRSEIEAAMTSHMGRSGPFDPSKGRHEVTTGAILDMLYDHATSIGATGTIDRNGGHGDRHRLLAIGGEHYSHFGDGLVPVLKDVLGAEAEPSLLAAWSDAYWAITRTVAAEPA